MIQCSKCAYLLSSFFFPFRSAYVFAWRSAVKCTLECVFSVTVSVSKSEVCLEGVPLYIMSVNGCWL